MGFLHRHRWLTPYLLLAPGLAWLAVFFVVPLGFLALPVAAERASFDVGYAFNWAWDNYSDALTQLPRAARPLVRLRGDRDRARARRSAIRSRTGSRSAAGAGRTCSCSSIIAPFFVTYLIRTLAWQTILSDDGRRRRRPADARASLGDDGRLLATSTAVVAGITYNFLPFMALPLYVVARADRPAAARGGPGSVREQREGVPARDAAALAAGRLRRHAADVHPGRGDFINAQLLGTPQQAMIGNVIQSKFLELTDYPAAAALSFVADGGDPRRSIAIYARVARDGEADRMSVADPPSARRSRAPALDRLRGARVRLPAAADRGRDRCSRSTTRPAASTTPGRGSRSTTGATGRACPGSRDAMVRSLEIAALASVVATALGTLIALALVRYGFRGRGATNLLIFLPMATPGDRARRVAADALPQPDASPLGFWTIVIAHIMFMHQLRRRDREGAADRLRPPPRGGGDGSRRQRVDDLPQGDAAADRARRSSPARCSPSRSRSTTS